MEQLEVLLLLRQHPSREWSARDVAHALKATDSSIQIRLQDLASRGFLSKGEDNLFRYDPPAKLRGPVDQLDQTYSSKKTSVIQLIFSGPSESIRSFSDAFRLREED